MRINELAKKHYKWLQEMGWTNYTPLEGLALITSEIGEAVNECRGTTLTPQLGSELADIILRTVGFAEHFKINIGKEIAAKMKVNKKRGTRGRVK